ncbi:mediator of RNA polymerase II transcription subunit 15a-like isoform X2 [Quercus lobata]|uniref:mediator of RNA polymerase II transcription subunit 15a-like isoform X2 n=1 Tax=Quercus lobata TaxID=97700 RepID=UPI001247A6B4|nr:mediator of RNA polymerase II transcription subunit 15a-like isoform X2 [Quercus lobata]
MRTRRVRERVVEGKNMRVVKRRRDFTAERSRRNSSDIAGKRDLFDSLPDDLVISILCKLSPSVFANVLLTCRSLNGLGLNSLVKPDSRQGIVNKIMETLKRHLHVSGQEGLYVLGKFAIRFEEKIYTAATNQSDYLAKIFLKLLTLENYSTAQTGHANGAGWQEEVYQKIETMKDLYLPEINEMYQKIAAKLQQHYDSLPQQSTSDLLEKLKVFKIMLERIITFLQVSKNNISPGYKEKLGSYEKQIVNCIKAYCFKKPALQQGQLPAPHMQTMQQPPQLAQIQSHENQMNPQLQSMNLQGSVPTMPQNSMSSLQHNSVSLSGASTAQPNMMNSLQPGSNLDSGQGNSLSSLQPVTMGCH